MLAARRLNEQEAEDFEGLSIVDGADLFEFEEQGDDELEPEDGEEASSVRVPAADDIRWHAWTRPLHDFLMRGDRSWPELKVWGIVTGTRLEDVRQLLAALEYMGDAYTIGEDVDLRWRGVGYRARTRGKKPAA